MSIQVQANHHRDLSPPRLGTPKWKDPERRQSIKDDSGMKMEWQLSTSLWTMTCWVALAPARPCLIDTIKQIEILVLKRQSDIWDGEYTSPGCAWDRSMHGRSIKDAQPTIIFSSLSRICRRNAKRIIQEERIEVDPRGIGIEYYENGPEFHAGSFDLERGYFAISHLESEPHQEKTVDLFRHHSPVEPVYSQNNQAGSSIQPSKGMKPVINAALINIGQVLCTMGGLLVINGELFGLTIAHAFESGIQTTTGTQAEPGELSQSAVRHSGSGPIGTLRWKRSVPQDSQQSFGDMDWALCTIDRTKMRLSNSLFLPDGNVICPRNVAQEDPTDMAVVIHTGPTGIVNGCIIGDYSLVALPGSKFFQRMWIVLLERQIQKGDCGSWVLDPTNGDWLGHIVAGKSGTSVAYIVLARDIVKSISDQVGVETVKMPCEVELEVMDAVNEIKKAIPLDEPGSTGPSIHSNLFAEFDQQLESPNYISLQNTTMQDPRENRSSSAREVESSGSRFARFRTDPIPRTLTQPPELQVSPRRHWLRGLGIDMNTNTNNADDLYSKIVIDRVDDHPEGWPSLAAFLNSTDSFAIFRRFGSMHCRELVMLQAEITALEKIRAALDRQDAGDPSTHYRLKTIDHHEAWDPEQRDLSEEIRKKLQVYGKLIENADDLLLKDAQLRALQQTSRRDHRNVFRWIFHRKPVDMGQYDWIYHADDFVSLNGTTRIPIFDMLLDYWPRAFRSKQVNVGDTIYSVSIHRVRSIAVLFAVAVLLTPVVLIFAVSLGRKELAAIVLASVFMFACVLSIFTSMEPAKIFIGTATYCAVMATFLGNVR